MLSFGIETARARSTALASAMLASGIGPALLGGHDDGARELREELAALGVGGALLVLDRGPLGVTGHAASLDSCRAGRAHALEEALVHARLAGQLGMEGRCDRAALLDGDRLAVEVREDLRAGADLLDARRADEDAVERRRDRLRARGRPRTSAAGGRSRCAARRCRSAPSRSWPGSPSLRLAREQDHARAGAEQRPLVAAQRGVEARRDEQLADRRRLAAGQHEARRSARAPSGVRTSTASAPRARSSATCSRNAPCSASTPTTLTSRAWPAARRPRACRARCRPSARRAPRRPWRAASRRGSA